MVLSNLLGVIHRNSLAVEVKNYGSSCGNYNGLGKNDVLNKNDLATCINCFLKSGVSLIADLSNCNKSRNCITVLGCAAETVVNCVTLSIEGRSYNLTCNKVVSVNLNAVNNNVSCLAGCRGVNDFLHIAVNVGTAINCYGRVNCVDTVLVIIIVVGVRNVECTVLNSSIEVGSDDTISTVTHECTTVEGYTLGRTGHCCPTDNGTILIKKSCACGNAVEVKSVNACSLEGYVLKYVVTTSVSPSLSVSALDVDILKSKVLKSTGKSALKYNVALTYESKACLHRRKCVCTCKNSYNVAVLSSVDCFFNRIIIGIVDLCNDCGNNLGRLLSVLNTYVAVSAGNVLAGVIADNNVISCNSTYNNCGGVNPLLTVCCKRNVLNGYIINRSAESSTGDTANDSSCADVKAGNLSILNVYAISIACDCGCSGSCLDIGAVVTDNLTVGNLDVAGVRITDNSTYAVNAFCVDCDITANSYVLNRALTCVYETNYCSGIVAGEACVDSNVLNGKILDYSIAVDCAKETCANVAVRGLFGLGRGKVEDCVTLTVEDTVEGSVASIADVYAPILARKIDVCAENYVNAVSVVLGLACVNAVTEELKILNRRNYVRICLGTCTEKLRNDNLGTKVDAAVRVKLGVVVVTNEFIGKGRRKLAIPVVTGNVNICEVKNRLLILYKKELVTCDADLRSRNVVKVENTAKIGSKNVVLDNDVISRNVDNLNCIVASIADVVAGDNDITAYVVCAQTTGIMLTVVIRNAINNIIGKGKVFDSLIGCKVEVNSGECVVCNNVVELTVGDSDVLIDNLAVSCAGEYDVRALEYDAVESDTLVLNGITVSRHNSHILEHCALALEGYVLKR